MSRFCRWIASIILLTMASFITRQQNIVYGFNWLQRYRRPTACVIRLSTTISSKTSVNHLSVPLNTVATNFRASLTEDEDNSAPNNPALMNRLKDLQLDNLVEVYKKLGGKPENISKQELAEKCFVLLSNRLKSSKGTDKGPSVSFKRSDERGDELIQNDNVISASNVVSSSIFKPTNLHNLQAIGTVKSLTPSGGSTIPIPPEMHEDSQDNKSDHKNNDERGKKAVRWPTGYRRDNRFSGRGSNDMELSFLGTASCVPSPTRGVSCIHFRYNQHNWLFDCGEATQLQMQKSIAKVSKINKIFITHLHGDHAFGLPGVLCLMGQARQAENFQSEDDVVDIYGPTGIRDYIRSTLQLTYSKIAVRHRIHELKNIPMLHVNVRPPSPSLIKSAYTPQYGEVQGGLDIFPDENGIYHLNDEDDVFVKAAPLRHTVPCVGYVVHEKDRLGKFLREKVEHLVESNFEALKTALNIRDGNRVYGLLKALKFGESFQFPDGTVVKGEDINEPPRQGRKVVVLGDTCNSDMLKDIAQDADVLVHECTNAWISYFDDVRYPNPKQLERETFSHGHSTPQMAGTFAKQINARKLYLTHFSSRYKGDDGESSMAIMWHIEKLARDAAKFPGGNDVVAAWDFLTLPVECSNKPVKSTREGVSALKIEDEQNKE